MLLRSCRRLFSSASPSSQEIQQESRKRFRARKFAWKMTALILPIACLSLYDRMAPLPEQLAKHQFPLMARVYIRKSLLLHKSDDLEGIAKDLDAALAAVISSGLGVASPQATALVVFLTKIYLDSPLTPPARLEEALAALTHKPHVGESLEDESSRLEMGLEVVKKLCAIYPEEHRQGLIDNYEAKISKCPPAISSKLQHKLLRFKHQNLSS